MDYLFKASGLVIILFIFYLVFLRNETFFKSIRSFFIIGLLIVIAMPLMEIPVYVETATLSINLQDYELATLNNTIEQHINWTQILIITYLLGVLFFSSKFLIQLISLGLLILKHEPIKQGGYYFIETSKNVSPFSFFNFIIFNRTLFTIDELEQIINHEKGHVNQWHSVDTILSHLLVITLWFNPFVWLFKKAVEQNLEFLADKYALELANNEKLYQFTLLKTCNPNFSTYITNNFYNSLIKKRIIMLHKNKSKNKNQWKYLLLLPLLVAFSFLFNTKMVAQENTLIEIIELQDDQLEIITKDSQKSDLEAIKRKLKSQGIDFSYSNLKFNSDNEITKISVKIKNNNGKASATWERKGSTIPTILVGEKNGQVIASSSKINRQKKHYTYTIHEDDSNLKKVKAKSDGKGNYIIVTSNGKTKKWKTKSSKSENIIVEEIYKDGNNEDETEVLIEIIEDGEHKTKILTKEHNIHFDGDVKKEREIKIEMDSDNASENIYIIETDGNNLKKHKITKKRNFVLVSTDDRNPLIFLNGKEITNEEMKKLDPNSIDKMEVLKGTNATDKYGERAKGGAILISSKKKKGNFVFVTTDNGNPLYFLNGKEITHEEMKKLDPDSIGKMEVLKGTAASALYGSRASNGVLLITTKI